MFGALLRLQEGIEHIAEVLGVSRRTVERDLTFAKAWLGSEIRRMRK